MQFTGRQTKNDRLYAYPILTKIIADTHLKNQVTCQPRAFKDRLLSTFKQQVMRDKCSLTGCLVGMKFPSLYLIFMDLLCYIFMMVYLYAFIFFHNSPPVIVSNYSELLLFYQKLNVRNLPKDLQEIFDGALLSTVYSPVL